MNTAHRIFFSDSRLMQDLSDESIDLVVTSPPYPMIEMWDEIMGSQNHKIKDAIQANDGSTAFELMHQELDKTWAELHRVIKSGGFVCINIGDATRNLGGDFRMYPNHSRIIHTFLKLGFRNLPNILWRKQTNAPNKFMGSGMLPAGAYVTLEHEHILIFRKGEKRIFKASAEKLHRQRSAFFWEERNLWFSDLWDLKGVNQRMNSNGGRERSAAYPFEIPYRLINMFSSKGDTILDPFLGTGTSLIAAITAGRNSVGYEIDSAFKTDIFSDLQSQNLVPRLNAVIQNRLANHKNFVENRKALKGDDAFKHKNRYYNFEVMTSQETEIVFDKLQSVSITQDSNKIEALHYTPLRETELIQVPVFESIKH